MNTVSLGVAPRSEEQGHFAENVAHFVRILRAAGISVGPERTLAALDAVQAVGVARKDDFRAALAAVLVSRQEHQTIFDLAFDAFWRNQRLFEKELAKYLPKVAGRAEPDAGLPSRLAQAMAEPRAPWRPDPVGDEAHFDSAYTFSTREVLRYRDFETMTAEELAAVRAMLARLRLPLPDVRTRRTTPATRGPQVDLRATMRRAVGAAGDMAPLARRERRRRTPPLVVLCDVSGSMD